jgi:predicted nucleotidyltransferase
MVRTALDLTPEEMRQFHPGKERDVDLTEERWKKAWTVARTAARLLRERFGATRVVAFGSLAHRAWFSPTSDVDLAAWGIGDSEYYRAVAAVTGISSDFRVDLVDPETCRPSMRRSIDQEGIDL